MKTHRIPRPPLALLSVLTLLTGRASAQSAPTNPTATAPTDSTVVLSPFTVTTEKDKGYKATNATTGTRLDTAIKDIPLNLEVITEQFIRDTGATDLRQALRYSAGVVLESQSDAFVEPDGDISSAGANDPRGATRRTGDSTTKLRGFVIDQVLRDGFRRQYSADSINIARVEVLRGPSALLYGVGSFGGVINYIPKRPELKPKFYTGVSAGSHGFFRSDFDFTGPLGRDNPWHPAYRITGAYQEAGDYTDLFNGKHLTVAPVFSVRPFPNTTIVLDNEFGYAKQTGVGFQNLRSNVNAAASRTASWITDTSKGLINLRTFRWSGPDTYLKGPFRNNIIDITQKIGDNLFIKVGAGESQSTFNSRQIRDTGTSNQPFVVNNSANYYSNASITIAGTAYNLQDAMTQAKANGTFQGLTPAQIYQNRPPGSFRGDRLYGFLANTPNEIVFQGSGAPSFSDTAAIRYVWRDSDRVETRDQVRADLNYKLNLGDFGKHNFIVGTQYMKLISRDKQYGPAYSYANHPVADIDLYSYHNPTDYSYFRYGTQGDGRPDAARQHLQDVRNQTWDLGYYAVYQGQFFKDRLTLIGGARWDRNDRLQRTAFIYESTKAPDYQSRVSSNAPTATSPQVGLSYAITRNINIFALYSTGVVPNYSARDGNGNAFAPTKAKNYEGGVKFDLFDGRLSGTISAYTIKRNNTPKNLWWAPSPYNSRLKGYDSTKPSTTVWQYWNPDSLWNAIQKTGAATAKKILPVGFHPTIDAMASVPASADRADRPESTAFNAIPGVQTWWSSAIDPVTQKRGLMSEAAANYNAGTTTGDVYFPLINMSDTSTQAFVQAAKVDFAGWGGNFSYTTGQKYFFADGTSGTGNAPDGNGADVPINDEAKGWDAQLIYSPTDHLQIVAQFAHIKRRITSQTYKFVAAPYWPIGWWYVRDGNFGTLSYTRTAAQAYGDVRDTTTYKAPIPEYAQAADDSPENTATLFARYSLDGIFPVKGVTVGGGGSWQDKRLWFTGFTGGGGNISAITDAAGNRVLVKLWTKTRLTTSLFAEYRCKISQKVGARFAFNVDNALDDQSRYGQVFAGGASYKFSAGFDF